MIESLRYNAGKLRYRLLNLVFRGALRFVSNDEEGREMLLASLAPQPGERILDLGVRGASSGLALAGQFPEAYFVALENDEAAFSEVNEKIKERDIKNFEVLRRINHRINSDSASFDKALSLLRLHSLCPFEKLALLKEVSRVLRRGGTLHIGDFDTPQTPYEHAMPRLARYLFGNAATQAHLDGTWVKMLREAGFPASGAWPHTQRFWDGWR